MFRSYVKQNLPNIQSCARDWREIGYLAQRGLPGKFVMIEPIRYTTALGYCEICNLSSNAKIAQAS